MKRNLFLLCMPVLLLMTGCSALFPEPTEPASVAVIAETSAPETTAPETEAPTEVPTQPEPTEPPDYVTSLLQTMTLRQKVGQLFIVHPDALDPPPDSSETCATSCTPAMVDAMKEYPVGGIIMFGENMESPDQLKQFNKDLQSCAEIPLFLCVDEEGGLVSRLANHKAFDLPKYRSAASVGKTGNPEKALEMGRTIGGYLREYSFNVDFAPVADVNTNPKNTVIGTRAFSSKPETAGLMATAMAEGLRENGIIPTFKHFPGHGDTAEDSHDALAVSKKTAAELADCEWIPFESATENDMIMVGHIALPSILNDRTPASMSAEVVTGILKNQLGFQGLVITDSLEMGAITDLYTSDQAALSALKAGCDLILMPANLEVAFEAVVEACETGELSVNELDARVERILRFKERHGILGIG